MLYITHKFYDIKFTTFNKQIKVKGSNFAILKMFTLPNMCHSDLQENMHIERIPSNAFLGLTNATITEL